MKKKFMALLLTLCMVFSMLPAMTVTATATATGAVSDFGGEGFSLSTSGTYPWEVAEKDGHEVLAATHGASTHTLSTLAVSFSESGVFSFEYSTSTTEGRAVLYYSFSLIESSADYRNAINSSSVGVYSGTHDWTTVPVNVSAGQTLYFVYAKKDSGTNNENVWLRNLCLATDGFSVSVSSSNDTYGTVSTTADSVAADAEDKSATLTATPQNGGRFYGWVENGAFLSAENPYTIEVQANRNITAVFGTASQYEARVDGTFYTSVKNAIDAADYGTSASPAYVVLSNNATISNDVSLNNYTVFVLPYSDLNATVDLDEETSDRPYSNSAKASPASGALTPQGTSVTYTLTVDERASLTVPVTAVLSVGGIYSGGQPIGGQVCGAHSEIDVEGTLNVSGILSCCGYVYGVGRINVTGGTVYENFTVTDFNGGSIFVQDAFGGWFPFSTYTVMGVQCETSFDASSYLKAYCALYVSSDIMQIPVEVVGGSQALIQVNSGTAVMKYDASKYFTVNNANIGTLNIKIYGNAAVGSMKLSLGGMAFDTQEFECPLPYCITIEQVSGTLDVTAKLKIMPGSALLIDEGATLNIGYGGSLNALLDNSAYENASNKSFKYPDMSSLMTNGYFPIAEVVVAGTLTAEDGSGIGGLIMVLDGGTVKVSEYADTSSLNNMNMLMSIDENVLTVGSTEFNQLMYTYSQAMSGDEKAYAALMAVSAQIEGGNTYVDENGRFGTSDFEEQTYTDTIIFVDEDYLDYVDQKGNAEGYTPLATVTQERHTELTYPNETPTKDNEDCGYNYNAHPFLGWAKVVTTMLGQLQTEMDDNNETIVYTTLPDVDGDAVYMAVYGSEWIYYDYTFTFEDGVTDEEITVPGATTVTNGNISYSDIAVPTRVGYTFAGWKLDSDQYNYVWRNGSMYTSTLYYSYGGLLPATPVNWIAQWTVNTYTVVFNANGGEGEMATQSIAYKTALPTNTFTNGDMVFVGWNTHVDGTGAFYADEALFTGLTDITLYAQWRISSATITWQNDDGTVLETDVVSYGETPVYDGETPAKDADAQYSYTFAGWDKEIVAATENTTYTATYTSTVNTYTVTWENSDGTVLETDENVEYGVTPSYDGETPIRSSDAQYTYTFSGWTPEVGPVDGDVTYTATYSTVTNTYTVTWLAEDGEKVLDTMTVAYGDTPEFIGTLPEKEVPEKGHWAFSWSPAVTAVTGDASYTATFTQAYYITVNYDSNMGTVHLKSKTGNVVETGTTVEYTGSRIRLYSVGNRGCGYTGWKNAAGDLATTSYMLTIDANSLTDDVTYTAEYEALTAMSIVFTIPEGVTATYSYTPYGGSQVRNLPLESGTITFYEKDSISLKATVESGYKFDYWLINGETQYKYTDYSISSNVMKNGAYTSIELVAHKLVENRTVTLHLPESGVLDTSVYAIYSSVTKSYTVPNNTPLPGTSGDVVLSGLTETDQVRLGLGVSADYIVNGWYNDSEFASQKSKQQSMDVTVGQENDEYWFSLTYDPYMNIAGYTAPEGAAVTSRTIREGWFCEDGLLIPTNLTTNYSVAPMKVIPESDGYLYFEYYFMSTGTWEYGYSKLKIGVDREISNYRSGGTYEYDKTSVWTPAYFHVTAGQVVYIVSTQQNDNGELDGAIRNLRLLTEDPSYTVASSNNEHGTVTAGGIEEGKATLGSEVTLTATPTEGYAFYAWVDRDSGEILSGDAEYTFAALLSRNIEGQFFPYVEDPVAKVGSIGFANLEDAIALAARDSASVILVKDYTQTANLTIPANVTLVIPYDAAVSDDHSETPNTTFAVAYVNPTVYKTLTVANNATITVKGKMVVDSKISANGQSPTPNGAPTGPYGKVVVEQGSSIVVKNGGSLAVWGFITAANADSLTAMNSSGTAAVTVESGAMVYETFQIMDWPGGRNIYGILLPAKGIGGEFTGIFPFSQYYVQNIEVPLVLQSGCVEQAVGCAYMSMKLYIPVEFVGPTGLFQLSSGYLRRTYDAAGDRTTYDVYGNMNLSNIMVPSPMPSMGPDLPSYIFTLPLTGNLSIKIHSGTTSILAAQALSLQPGLEFVVDEGATLNLPNANYLLDSEDYVGKGAVFSNKDLIQVKYIGLTAGAPVSRTLKDAMIDINGTVNVSGALYTSESGANITSSGGTGKLVLTAAAPEATTTYASNAGAKVVINVTPAQLLNADGTYTQTAGSTANTTFYYANGTWAKDFTLTYDANAGEEDIAVPEEATYALDGTATITVASALTSEGYVFTGWNTVAAPTEEEPGTSYEAGAEIHVTQSLGASMTLYAQWEEVSGYAVTVENKTGTTTPAVVSIESGSLQSGETTFYVTCEKACVVVVDNGDGTYTRLTATATGTENTYSFTINVAEEMTIVVAIKGDLTLDGEINSTDAMQAQRYDAKLRTLSALQKLAADINKDGEVNSTDAMQIQRCEANLRSFNWDT